MKSIVFWAFSLFFAPHCLAQSSNLTPIGEYSNMEVSDGEETHFLSGYNLTLYRAGSEVVGDIGIAIGSPEPATANLYDVKYDASKKTISFKAKYIAGSESSNEAGKGERDVRVLLSFSGRLMANAIEGKFTLRSGYHPTEAGEQSHAVLKREPDSGSAPMSFKSWKEDQTSRAPNW